MDTMDKATRRAMTQGKGSKRRPENPKLVSQNWDNIFGPICNYHSKPKKMVRDGNDWVCPNNFCQNGKKIYEN